MGLFKNVVNVIGKGAGNPIVKLGAGAVGLGGALSVVDTVADNIRDSHVGSASAGRASDTVAPRAGGNSVGLFALIRAFFLGK